jgi:hypothetical protein
MALSISHFKSLVPWQAARLLVAALAVWAAGAFYTLRLNPELAFYREGHRLKQEWVQKMNREHASKVIFFGGSSCACSINARQMVEQDGLPAVNLGLAAGMGAKVLTLYSLQAARPGDLVVIALEPDLLAAPLELEPFGIQFAMAAGDRALVQATVGIDWPSALADLRPGSYHLCTLLGKLILREPLYRYTPSQWHESGWQEITTPRPFSSTPVLDSLKLSDDGKAWLRFISDYCAAHHLRVALVLPWCYTSPSGAPALRSQYLGFLREIAEFIPLLKDPYLGVHTDRSIFSDSALHLTPAGATFRTSELAREIKAGKMWTREELIVAGLRDPATAD